RLVALYNYPESLESYVQMIGRAGRDGRASDTLLLASRADAGTLKRFARSDIPTRADLRAVYARLRGRSEVQPEELGSGARNDPDPRVLVGMLEQVGLVHRGFDVGRSMQIEVPAPPADSGERIDRLLARYESEAIMRADRLVRFAESSRCRHRQVAEHFGETLDEDCGMCDVCSPLPTAAVERIGAVPLPGDIGAVIYRAVLELRWPLGRTGLTALLRGSMSAPKSARRSSAFGILSAATQADVKRWIQLLEVAGALQAFESEDGFRLLRAVPSADVPAIATAGNTNASPADEGLFERLRTWRLERARTDEVPAYVVLHDATLRELASAKPTSEADLAGVKGFGPAKLERYAEDVLAVISATGP
nr:HRDC domain-containing protein [Actinomycetota bacterium]